MRVRLCMCIRTKIPPKKKKSLASLASSYPLDVHLFENPKFFLCTFRYNSIVSEMLITALNAALRSQHLSAGASVSQKSMQSLSAVQCSNFLLSGPNCDLFNLVRVPNHTFNSFDKCCCLMTKSMGIVSPFSASATSLLWAARNNG